MGPPTYGSFETPERVALAEECQRELASLELARDEALGEVGKLEGELARCTNELESEELERRREASELAAELELPPCNASGDGARPSPSSACASSAPRRCSTLVAARSECWVDPAQLPSGAVRTGTQDLIFLAYGLGEPAVFC